MKFSVHKSPPSTERILRRKKEITSNRIIGLIAIFAMAAIGLISDGIRFDFAILGMAISCVLFISVLFITGVLEPTKFKFISEDYNDELVGMSVQNEAVLAYIKSTNGRKLVRGELAELVRYYESTTKKDEVIESDDNIDDIMSRVKETTAEDAA